MNKADLIYVFIKFMISTVVIIFTIAVLWRKRLIKWERVTDNKKAWVREHEEKANKICYIVLVLTSLILLMNITIPYIRDVPYIIKGEYLIITGVAKKQDHGGRDSRQERNIEIVDENGRSERVSFFSDFIDEGEEVTVIYLPHLKYGTRIR